MTGITNLQLLLKEMEPVLEKTEYVFICMTESMNLSDLNPIATMLEQEGMSAVITKELADQLDLSYQKTFQKITLEVHSSLEAVGLTAAISTALTAENIPANIIAGYYHDHLFVPSDQSERSLEILQNLASK